MNRPTLDTLDISGEEAPPLSSATPFHGVPSLREIIDRESLADAIRPSGQELDDHSTRRLERPLLEPELLHDTEPPPPLTPLPPSSSPNAAGSWRDPALGAKAPPSSTWWSTRTSGVRPIRRPSHETRLVPPTDELAGGELARARAMARAVAVVGVVGTTLLQLIAPIFDLGHVMASAALLAAVGTALSIEVVVALHGGVSRRHHVALGFVASAALLVVLAHSGPVSPLALVALLIAHHYAATTSRRASLIVAATLAGGLLAEGALAGSGLLGHAGTFTVTPMATYGWSVALAVFVVLVATTGQRRVARVAHARQRARSRVSRREALIDEAYATIGVLRAARVGHRTGTWLGRYLVDGVVGRSHRAEIYEGCAGDGERAAIKLFEPGLDRSTALQMFNQASSASAVSLGFVRIYDYGAVPGGSFFIATERLSGPDLATQLREPWAMSNTESLILLAEVAEALERAHESRLYHGNLKPENLVLDAAGRWRITDFATPPAAMAQSVPAPRYAAPGHGPIDARADVFSLAAIAYRLLIRCPPFCDSDPFEIGGPPRPVRPTALAPVHADVDAILALGLAPDPSARIASPGELVRALRLALEGALPEPLRLRAAADTWAEPRQPD